MANETTDYVSISIDEELREISPLCSLCSIAIVPWHLRNVNDKAYDPLVLSIGPYHRGKTLKRMEEQKKLYLRMLLQRRREAKVTRYVEAMRALETKARTYYAEDINLESNEFVRMMLVDSCFIVELLRMYTMAELRDNNDPIFKEGWIIYAIGRDLLLAENQLPFFVVQEFFEMTLMPNNQHDFSTMFSSFIGYISSFLQTWRPPYDYSVQEPKHLLDLLHDGLHPSCPETWNNNRNVRKVKKGNWELTRCATELQEAGIKFSNKVETNSLFDIKFERGVLKIPRLDMEVDTECFFRNVIAYEQTAHKKSNYVSDYVKFMDCLINSPKDVKILCQEGVIHNWLGDDEAVARIFNRLGDSVGVCRENYYSETFHRVNMHCSRSWNRWIANLRHKYFTSPWAFISLLAAFLLLLLTFVQTVFSVLAVIRSDEGEYGKIN